jgi:radical SAM protein with 4Fe4S-binding SPASM domain
MQIIKVKEAFNGKSFIDKVKIYRWLWDASLSTEVLLDFPLNMDIEFSALCNLNCERCIQHDMAGKIRRGTMDYNLFTDIIDEAAPNGTCAIKSCLRGEPFMQPRLFDMIEYANKKGIIDTILTTNVTLFDQKTIDNIFNSGITGLAFSVDMHHANSVEKNGSKYTSVEEKINYFLEERERRNKKFPWVRIQTNIESDGSAAILSALKEKVKEKFSLADMFMVGRLLDFRPDYEPYPDTKTYYKDTPCVGIFHRMFITWDGKMLPCAMDYRENMVLDQFGKSSISSVWHSEVFQDIRSKHKNYKMDDIYICRHCHFRYGPKKEDIFLEDGEEHSKLITECLLSSIENRIGLE